MLVRRVGARLLAIMVISLTLALASCTPGGVGGRAVTIGSKNDADGQLLATMYALLLQHNGFAVTTRIPLGETNVLDAAIKNGAIDIYPEFTGTALTLLNLPSTQNATQAYNQVKSVYESQFQITWLAPAYQLNDSYGLCASRDIATRYQLRSIADLAPVAGQLTVAQQHDADPVLAAVEARYGFHFKQSIYTSEQSSFGAVQQGKAQVNVCYTTDPAIAANDFVLLSDPLQAFPVYNPAPLVRSSVLRQWPEIASTLDPLATHLSTTAISALIKRVTLDHQPVDAVAQDYLRSAGLLPAS